MRDEKAIITLREPFNRLIAVSDHLKCGRGGIRTHGTGLAYTRFPSVLLKPLGHPSKRSTRAAYSNVFVTLVAIKNGKKTVFFRKKPVANLGSDALYNDFTSLTHQEPPVQSARLDRQWLHLRPLPPKMHLQIEWASHQVKE